MLEEGEVDHNGKSFDAKLEEGYGVLGDIKPSLQKGLAGHQYMSKQERQYFEEKHKEGRGI